MRGIRNIVFLMVVVFCLPGCGGSGEPKGEIIEPPTVTKWPFEDRAIRLSVDNSGSKLNWEMDKTHPLVLSVLQFMEPTAYNNLRTSAAGLGTMIASPPKEPIPGLLRTEQIIVQPGDKRTMYFSRAENAQWIAVITGYYHLTPGRVDRLFPIPFKRQKVPGGPFGSKKVILAPIRVGIDLILGANMIESVKYRKLTKDE